MMEYPLQSTAAAYSAANERAAFIRRTYAHLAGAIAAFAMIETIIFNVVPTEELARYIGAYFASPVMRLIVIAAFIGTGALARYWASSGVDSSLQYAGLALYVMVQAVIFVPLLFVAMFYAGDPYLIHKAGILTLSLFAGLTAVVFVTRTDFSWLAPILMIASFLALGFVVCALIFGISVGNWYAFAMVALAAGFILYDTSNVLHHFRTDQHVAASLDLFASVAFLFYYIIVILLNQRR